MENTNEKSRGKGRRGSAEEPCSQRGGRGHALGHRQQGQEGRRAGESPRDDKTPLVTVHGQQRKADSCTLASEEDQEVRDSRDKNSQDTLNSIFFS